MKQLTFLIFTLIINQGFIKAQGNLDSTKYLIDRLIIKVNDLPRTNVSQGDFKFQSQYSLQWNKKKNTFTLSDKRYKPNSNRKLSDKHIIEFDILSLHKNGVFVRSLRQDQNVSLQIFTANNDMKIKSQTYYNGEYRFGMNYDRFTIGDWDSLVIKNQLDTIKELFIEIIHLNTDWDEKATPDIHKTVIPVTIKETGFKYSSITYEQNEESPLFLNSSIEEPALFLDSKSDKENREIISKYILEQIDKEGIKMKGNISGTIIISKSGDVEDFKSFNMNKPEIEQEVKAIILSMPNWKAGKHKGDYVMTSLTILIKK